MCPALTPRVVVAPDTVSPLADTAPTPYSAPPLWYAVLLTIVDADTVSAPVA